jgi:hypothetical protein
MRVIGSLLKLMNPSATIAANMTTDGSGCRIDHAEMLTATSVPPASTDRSAKIDPISFHSPISAPTAFRYHCRFMPSSGALQGFAAIRIRPSDVQFNAACNIYRRVRGATARLGENRI